MTTKTNAGGKKSPFALAADLFKRALGIAQLEMSQEDMRNKIYEALSEKYADPMMGDGMLSMTPYMVATYADRVIVSHDSDYFEIKFTLDADGNIQLGEPVAVEISWTPKQGGAAMSALPASSVNSTPAAPVAAPAPISTPAPAPAAPSAASLSSGTAIPTPKGGESNMGNTNQSTPAPAAPIVPPVPAAPPAPTAPPENLTPEARIAAAREEARLAALGERDELEKKIVLAREQERTTILAEMARKQEVITLATKLTSGKFQLPYKTSELNDILVQLSDADRALIAPVLEKIHTAGVVELGERGSSAHGGGFKELAAFAKPLLKEWLAKGDTIEAFFAANPELGKVSEYNLTEFEKK